MPLMQFITVEQHDNKHQIAYYHEQPMHAKTAILWLSGYCSVMNSTKATAIAEFAAQNNIEMMRFDYSGLGHSEGDFATANLSAWLAEALAIYQLIQARSVIIVGSSMGAWLALRLTEKIIQTQLAPEPKALLLLAPAVDFTHEIVLKQLPEALHQQLNADGMISFPSPYDLKTLTFYEQFLNDAGTHLLFDHPSVIHCPIHIIHGAQDQDIPIKFGEKAAIHFSAKSMLKLADAEHRLSRKQDIQNILNTLQTLV